MGVCTSQSDDKKKKSKKRSASVERTLPKDDNHPNPVSKSEMKIPAGKNNDEHDQEIQAKLTPKQTNQKMNVNEVQKSQTRENENKLLDFEETKNPQIEKKNPEKTKEEKDYYNKQNQSQKSKDSQAEEKKDQNSSTQTKQKQPQGQPAKKKPSKKIEERPTKTLCDIFLQKIFIIPDRFEKDDDLDYEITFLGYKKKINLI